MVNRSDVGTNRLAAPALTAGAALKAAPSLSHCLVRGESQADLLEIPPPHPRLSKGNLLTRLLWKVL